MPGIEKKNFQHFLLLVLTYLGDNPDRPYFFNLPKSAILNRDFFSPMFLNPKMQDNNK